MRSDIKMIRAAFPALVLGLAVGLGVGRLTAPAPALGPDSGPGPDSTPGAAMPAPPSTERPATGRLASATPRTDTSPGAASGPAPDRIAIDAGFALEPANASASGLRDLLDGLFSRGLLHQRLVEDPQRVAAFLIEQCLGAGDVDAAWAIAASEGIEGKLWFSLARQLQRDDPRRALEAYRLDLGLKLERALEDIDEGTRSGRRWRELASTIEGIAQIDVAAALAQLDELRPTIDLRGQIDDSELVGWLVEAGRTADAFDLIDRRLDAPYADGEALWLAMNLESAAAEDFLRRRLDLDPSNADLQACLANVLIEGGEQEQGRELLLDLLDTGARADPELIAFALDSMPLEQIADRAAAWIADPASPLPLDTRRQLESRLIEDLINGGREDEAIEMQVASLERFAREGGSDHEIPAPAAELFASYADRVVPALRNAEHRARSNDELWGDLGDMYWQAGFRDDARRCWVRAWELDRSDGEWLGNLRALEAGEDPY
jgi:hypothetical protein